MSRLFQTASKFKSLAYVIAIAYMLMLAGHVNAAGNSLPYGTKGWLYYIGIGAVGYAASPEEACRLTAMNHMGTALVDMSAPRGPGLLIECQYPHFLAIGGVHWYGATFLECESGYRPTPEGICAKVTEPAPPLHCKPGEAGGMCRVIRLGWMAGLILTVTLLVRQHITLIQLGYRLI